MQIQSAMLISDWLVYGLLLIAIICFFWMRRKVHLRDSWRQVMQSRIGMIALVILSFYVAIGLLDSIHLRITHYNAQGQQISSSIKSGFDILVSPLGSEDEKTYSAPFAIYSHSQALITTPDGKEIRTYPRLRFGGRDLKNTNKLGLDITLHVLRGLILGLLSFGIIAWAWLALLSRKHHNSWRNYFQRVFKGKTAVAWREAIITFGIIWLLIWILAHLATHYHIFGTDKIGRDVFYLTLKSIRTGLLIGTLTTLFMLPFALLLGTAAGYFGGIADDIIQYLYTTLSSIPGVLLISATILVLQIYFENHPELFPTLIQRADARLLALCLILGITSWASLCRLLRGETLKLREQQYVEAARSLGVRKPKIILRHIVPNVMHIILITLVLDFSNLVLAEAVLSYVGIGVDPTTMSWGNMINTARLELAREPIVWWPLVAALIFMFILVLSANLFADRVRDAFDPRLRHIEQ